MKNVILLLFLVLTTQYYMSDHKPDMALKVNKIRKEGYILGCVQSKRAIYKSINGLKANAKIRREIKEKCNDLYIDFTDSKKMRLYYVQNR